MNDFFFSYVKNQPFGSNYSHTFKLCWDRFTSLHQKATIVIYLIERTKKKRRKKNRRWQLACLLFFLRATDHLHENMQYSRDDDNNIDVEKISLFPSTHTSLNRSKFFSTVCKLWLKRREIFWYNWTIDNHFLLLLIIVLIDFFLSSFSFPVCSSD